MEPHLFRTLNQDLIAVSTSRKRESDTFRLALGSNIAWNNISFIFLITSLSHPVSRKSFHFVHLLRASFYLLHEMLPNSWIIEQKSLRSTGSLECCSWTWLMYWDRENRLYSEDGCIAGNIDTPKASSDPLFLKLIDIEYRCRDTGEPLELSSINGYKL